MMDCEWSHPPILAYSALASSVGPMVGNRFRVAMARADIPVGVVGQEILVMTASGDDRRQSLANRHRSYSP
jgi:hypothetical protein